MEEITGRNLFKLYIPPSILMVIGKLGDFLAKTFEIETVINSESFTYATNWVCTDDSIYFNDLGLQYRDGTESLKEAVRSLWLAGYLNRYDIGKLAEKPVVKN